MSRDSQYDAEDVALAEWLQVVSQNNTQAWHGDFNGSFTSGALFPGSNNVDGAIGDMVERWEGDAYQMLFFNRLLSAKILQNQATSAFYLAHIYQHLSAQRYGSQTFIPSSLSNPSTRPSLEKRRVKNTSNRTPRRQHTNETVDAQPPDVNMPLEIFFSQYSEFRYQASISPVFEFNRLCKEYRWKKRGREMKTARHDFGLAMRKEFDSLYGSDEKDIKNWYKLCHVLRIDPVPKTLKECRTAVCRMHVNLVDLVAGSRETIWIFKSEKELSEYTIETEKIFPREDAADGGVLRALRRHIWAPRDGY